MDWRHAGFIGTLLNKELSQSSLERDAAVFVSLSSPDHACGIARRRKLIFSVGALACPS